jgi:zinc protease
LRNRRAAAALLACAAALPADAARAGEPTAEPPAAAAAEQPAGSDTSDVFPYPVHRQTLDNGLQVVAVPFASPGVVAYFTVVRTGSRQEVEAGHSGFAHFFEHVMFRGTERYPSEVYNDVLKRMGADSNAFTTDDYTLYYIVGPAAASGPWTSRRATSRRPSTSATASSASWSGRPPRSWTSTTTARS